MDDDATGERLRVEAVGNRKLKHIPLSPRFYGLLMAAGYLAVAIIHWRHSLGALTEGYVYADLGDSPDSSYVLEILQTLTLACLFAIYLFCLTNWERLKFDLRTVASMGLLPALFACAALPANSTDVFAYIGLGRVAAVFGSNPYIHTYSEFADFYSAYVEWDITMPYGPAALPPLILAGWISQHSVLAAVFALKLFWLLIHCCNCYLLCRILYESNCKPAPGLLLFGLNPLVLLELIANGHNDGLMIMFWLLSFFAMLRRRLALALVFALLSALVKMPGILFLAAIGVYLARRREWKALGQGAFCGAVLLLALKATLLPTAGSVMSLTNLGGFTKNSIHELLIIWAEKFTAWAGAPIDYETLYSIDRRVFNLLLFCFCLWRLWKIIDWESMAREFSNILLALLLVYAVWFFPWYATWLVPLAAMTRSSRLRRAILIFSLTSLALYAFPHYVVNEAPLHSVWAALRIAIVHLVPLGSLTCAWFVERQCRPAPTEAPSRRRRDSKNSIL
jgi:alpha-1,6-mannosyltransferase